MTVWRADPVRLALGASAIALAAPGNLLASPRFEVRASGQVVAFPVAEFVRQTEQRLVALGWTAFEKPPDADLQATLTGSTHEVCATIHARWWDDVTAKLGPHCAPRQAAFFDPRPPTAKTISNKMVEPLCDALDREQKARWEARFTHADPTKLDALTVKVGAIDAKGHVSWNGPRGSLSVAAARKIAVERGPCKVELAASAPELDLSVLWPSVPMKFEWEIDRSPSKDIRKQKDTPFELAVTATSSATDTITLPCAGKLAVTLVDTPKDYVATNLGRLAEPNRWAWTVRTKAESGTIVAQLRAENAGDRETPTISIGFNVPWYHKLWAQMVFVAGGIAVIAKAVQEVRKALQSGESKGAKENDDAAEKTKSDKPAAESPNSGTQPPKGPDTSQQSGEQGTA
jgi:hypothetical protein